MRSIALFLLFAASCGGCKTSDAQAPVAEAEAPPMKCILPPPPEIQGAIPLKAIGKEDGSAVCIIYGSSLTEDFRGCMLAMCIEDQHDGKCPTSYEPKVMTCGKMVPKDMTEKEMPGGSQDHQMVYRF